MIYNLKIEGNFLVVYKGSDVVFNYPQKSLTYVILNNSVLRLILLNIHDEYTLVGKGEVDFNTNGMLNDGVPFVDINEIRTFLNNNLSFNNGGGLGNEISLSQQVKVYSDLIDGEDLGELSYVEESQGTSWLPFTVDGTYYPSGWYVWDGTAWVSDRNAIANQLESTLLSLDNKASLIHTHIESDIIDLDKYTKAEVDIKTNGVEYKVNKATDFTILNDILYPTTKSVNDFIESKKSIELATLDSNGKLKTSQVPDLAITSVQSSVENTLQLFVTNNGNYSFEEGDVIIINDGSGNLTHYMYDGGVKNDINSYSLININEIDTIEEGKQIKLTDCNEIFTLQGAYKGDFNRIIRKI